MKTGKRRARIIYQRDVGTTDLALGTSIPDWQDQARDFAEIRTAGGREEYRGDQVQLSREVVIETRYRRDIKPDESWRIYVPEFGQTFQITYVEDVDFKKKTWLLYCSA